MKNKEFAREMERRTLQFAVRIIRLASHLPTTAEGKVVRNQMTKSGTSIGANYREANELEAGLISRTGFRYVRLRQAKHSTGLKSLERHVGCLGRN